MLLILLDGWSRCADTITHIALLSVCLYTLIAKQCSVRIKSSQIYI